MSSLHHIVLLAHLTSRLKWAFLIKICQLSVVIVVVVVVVMVVINFSNFHLLLQNHWANFNQTWHKASLGKGNSSLFKWRAQPFSKNTLTKSSSPEPLGQFQPNLSQCVLGWRGIQVCSNEGLPFYKGDNYQIAKIHWQNLKNLLLLNHWAIVSTKVSTMHPWVKGIQICSNEGPRPFPSGNNYQIVKIHWRN